MCQVLHWGRKIIMHARKKIFFKNKLWLIAFLMLIIVISVGLIMLKMGEYFLKKDLISRDTSIICAQREYLEEDTSYITRLYKYNLEGQETVLEEQYEFFDMVSSKDNNKLLSFIGHKEHFNIVEYDIKRQELRYILSTEQIEAFLDENGYKKSLAQREGSCVKYYDNENGISFLYDNYVMGYSEKKGLEMIYAIQGTAGNVYCWMEDDTSLLINEGTELIKYNTLTGEKTTLLTQPYTFSFVLSTDESFVVFEDREKGYLWIYNLKSGERKKLCKRYHPFPELQISEDNRYLLCKDSVQVLSSSKKVVYIVDIESGKKAKVKEWGFDTDISAVAWNR